LHHHQFAGFAVSSDSGFAADALRTYSIGPRHHLRFSDSLLRLLRTQACIIQLMRTPLMGWLSIPVDYTQFARLEPLTSTSLMTIVHLA
jgi:hypothetical protein